MKINGTPQPDRHSKLGAKPLAFLFDARDVELCKLRREKAEASA